MIPQDYRDAAEKLHRTKIRNCVTLISGLGGRDKVEQHAIACADLVSAMKPEYCSFLTLRLYAGTLYRRDGGTTGAIRYGTKI